MIETLRDNLDVLWGFGVALAVVLVLTPAVGRVARVLGVVDEPLEKRRVHLAAVPRLGGVALFLGIFIPALAFLELDGAYRGILLGAALATTVGMVDDFRGLPWWGKLGGQVAAAAIPVYYGVDIDRFTFPILGLHSLPEWLAAVLAIVWIVALMNMVNFLDGLDGLAAGICCISGATFAVIALSLDRPDAAVLSAIVAGACLGFLRHNFYPARIFMGDSGSFVVARRIKHGEKFYRPDQAHLHHRFLRRGFSQRRAVLYLYAWCVILGGAALATRFVPFREGGEWHLWPTVAAALIAAFAVLVSLYIVYVVEILKLRRVRSWVERRRVARDERELKSA
jgi:UDP-GlcNAc:undecaprenyl-phosphate GlcNAc-1-phosphate transferase